MPVLTVSEWMQSYDPAKADAKLLAAGERHAALLKETQDKKKGAEKQLKSAYANLRVCDKFNGNDDMSSSIKDNIKRLDVILALKDLWEGYTYESTYLDEDNEEQIEGRHALQDIAEALRAIADCVDTDTRDLLQSYIYTLLVPFFYHQIIHHFHQLPEPLAVYFNILLFPILFKSFFIHKSNYLGNYNSVGQFPVLRLALRGILTGVQAGGEHLRHPGTRE
mgnify:CR=1 FL=1